MCSYFGQIFDKYFSSSIESDKYERNYVAKVGSKCNSIINKGCVLKISSQDYI